MTRTTWLGVVCAMVGGTTLGGCAVGSNGDGAQGAAMEATLTVNDSATGEPVAIDVRLTDLGAQRVAGTMGMRERFYQVELLVAGPNAGEAFRAVDPSTGWQLRVTGSPDAWTLAVGLPGSMREYASSDAAPEMSADVRVSDALNCLGLSSILSRDAQHATGETPYFWPGFFGGLLAGAAMEWWYGDDPMCNPIPIHQLRFHPEAEIPCQPNIPGCQPGHGQWSCDSINCNPCDGPCNDEGVGCTL